MPNQYILMHKDTPCGALFLDGTSNRVISYKDFNSGCSPFLGTANTEKIKKWWEMRAIPGNRQLIKDITKSSEILNAESYLAKNLALSLTDSYWINPADSELTYTDVNLRNHIDFNEGKIPYHNATSYDANASLGGQMEKYWDLSKETPVLVKESYKYFGQQSINEAFATKLHESLDAGVPFVKYTAERKEDNGVICKCDAFTSENIELISAYEVLESFPKKNERSTYDTYIDICEKIGIPRDVMQKFMDYQTSTGFLLTDQDKHLLNVAILRDSDTMKILGPAPIFDSGNSMFYKDSANYKKSRVQILEDNITSFYSSEEKMLAKVQDKRVLDIDKIPSSAEVIEFYTKYGIPEEKATTIAYNYKTKAEMFAEFQRGEKISLYNEKQKEIELSSKQSVTCVTKSGNEYKLQFATNEIAIDQQTGTINGHADAVYIKNREQTILDATVETRNGQLFFNTKEGYGNSSVIASIIKDKEVIWEKPEDIREDSLVPKKNNVKHNLKNYRDYDDHDER